MKPERITAADLADLNRKRLAAQKQQLLAQQATTCFQLFSTELAERYDLGPGDVLQADGEIKRAATQAKPAPARSNGEPVAKALRPS